MARTCILTSVMAAVWLQLPATICAQDTQMATTLPSIGPQAIEVAELQDQLVFGLRAGLPTQVTFIRRVVSLVDNNRLPLDMVMGTFQWARHKEPHPFPYFERAMRLRAARRGIQL